MSTSLNLFCWNDMRSTIAMIEAGRSCVDLAQQLHAIEKAVCNANRGCASHGHTNMATPRLLTGTGTTIANPRITVCLRRWKLRRHCISMGMHGHKTTARTALLLILGSSPMVEGIPAFFAAGKFGVGLIVLILAYANKQPTAIPAPLLSPAQGSKMAQ